jgi:hypothetical protein
MSGVDPDSEVLCFPAPSPSGGGGAVATYVSLFLLLFVFFIMLFSTASVERQRLGAVVGGIDRAFDRLPSRLGLLPSVTDGALSAAEPFGQALEHLVGNIGAVVSPRPGGPGTVIQLALSTDRLFDGASAQLSPGGEAFLRGLADLLARPSAGSYRLAWRVPASDADQDPQTALRRARAAVALARLGADGAPLASLAMASRGGETPASPDELDFAPLAPAAD